MKEKIESKGYRHLTRGIRPNPRTIIPLEKGKQMSWGIRTVSTMDKEIYSLNTNSISVDENIKEINWVKKGVNDGYDY